MSAPTTSIYLNSTTPAAPAGKQNIVFQSDGATPQQSVTAYVPGLPNFADNETVTGSGTAWTLAHTPNPAASLILVQHIVNFGGIVLIAGTDYTISGTAVTTTNSLSSGVLRAWYRY